MQMHSLMLYSVQKAFPKEQRRKQVYAFFTGQIIEKARKKASVTQEVRYKNRDE